MLEQYTNFPMFGDESEMSFIKAASTKDIPSQGMTGVTVKDTPVLIANVNGKYFAIGNECTHKGCTLSDGQLEDNNVTCPCHGSTFDVKTGKVVSGPATKPEPSFPVKVEKDQILVSV